MDSKSAIKSKIPTTTRKKEQTNDTPTPKLSNKEPPKTLETKNNAVKPKTSRSEPNAKAKTSREMQVAKKNVEKTTFSDKTPITSNNLKLKRQNKHVSPKEIEKLSKGMVNLMKTSKVQELKTNSKLGGAAKNRISKQADGASSSQFTNTKEETKNKRENPLKSIGVAKKPTVANPFKRISQLRRRSRTENELNFGKAGSSSISSPLKSVPDEKIRNANQDKEVVKNSVLTENETCTTLKKNSLPKESSPLVRSGSVRVPRKQPFERKATKPIHSELKPLKRSNTIHVFQSVVPVLKLSATIQTEKYIVDLKADLCAVSKNQQLQVLGGNAAIEAQMTPKKQIPHGGIPFKIHCAKKAKAGSFNAQSEK